MRSTFDLRDVAAGLAEDGPSRVLNPGTVAEIEAVVADPAVLDRVSEKVGSTARASDWLRGMMRSVHGAVGHPDDDHAFLVGSLGALGSLLAREKPEQATISFEAVSLT